MINSAFIKPKYGNGSRYNFDLKELIKDFSFYDFVDNGSKNQTTDFGGFLVITNNQYVVGYNSGFGVGTHLSSFGRFMKDIHGGGEIHNDRDLTYLAYECQNKYITAKIVYEIGKTSDNTFAEHFGGLYFQIPRSSISENELKLFKEFYKEYNDDIKMAVKRSKGNFKISFFSRKTGNVDCGNDLDKLLVYLESIVDYNLTDNDNNEVIIGEYLNEENQFKY